MAFEDLKKAFIEAELEKLAEKKAKLKKTSKDEDESSNDKVITKGKLKKKGGKKLALTKAAKKAKGKAKVLKEIEGVEKKPKVKSALKNKKGAKDKSDESGLPVKLRKEAKKQSQKADDVELSLSDKAMIATEKAALRWAEVPDSTSIAQPDANVPSVLEQKEIINKTLPDPEKFVANLTEKLVAGMKSRNTEMASKSISAPKTPITEEVKAAKEAALKSSESGINDLTRLYAKR